MREGQPYRLARHGNLLVLRAAAGGGNKGVVVVRLAVDMGASYTTLPVEVVETLGCDTHHPLRTVRIVAANGIIVAPVVALPWFHCLGQRLSNFPVVAHTLPAGTFVDGLLGMDFLTRCRAVIAVGEATLQCHEPSDSRVPGNR